MKFILVFQLLEMIFILLQNLFKAIFKELFYCMNIALYIISNCGSIF